MNRVARVIEARRSTRQLHPNALRGSLMAEIRIGTCSWKYDSWKGTVYSEKVGRNHLREYAIKFDTVEIDQWFWSLHGPGRITLPDPSTVLEYASSVPDGFRFSIKVPDSITLTHFRKKSKTDPLVPNPHFLSVALFGDFLAGIEPLAKTLGPLIFQFEYLNKLKMPSQKGFQEAFEAFIRKCPSGYVYCVETRNPNYLNTDYFSFLNRNGLHPVFLQGYYMPPIVDIYKDHADKIRELAVLRLHGPDREGMEEKTGGSWDKIVAPKDEELDRIAGMAGTLVKRDVSVYFNVNNHYEGCAPLTVEKIRRLMKM
jgi:uncharacterized protein YecE (DUF72 family)